LGKDFLVQILRSRLKIRGTKGEREEGREEDIDREGESGRGGGGRRAKRENERESVCSYICCIWW
jgi:hypothetical protein